MEIFDIFSDSASTVYCTLGRVIHMVRRQYCANTIVQHFKSSSGGSVPGNGKKPSSFPPLLD